MTQIIDGQVHPGDTVPVGTSAVPGVPNTIPSPTNTPPDIPVAPPLQGGAYAYEGKNVNVPIYITLWDIRRIIEETMDKKFKEWEKKMGEL